MKVVYSKGFLKAVALLPERIQQKLDELIALLADDPFHPLLHTKRLSGSLSQFYAFRITREWRVIFSFELNETIRLVKVGHRKDVYGQI